MRHLREYSHLKQNNSNEEHFFYNVLNTKGNARTFLGAVPGGGEPQIWVMCQGKMDMDPQST